MSRRRIAIAFLASVFATSALAQLSGSSGGGTNAKQGPARLHFGAAR